MKVRYIELLAPAKNAETGIEAIKHGADAIYIGAPAFSARSAASNTIEEIEQVVKFAHLYHAKVYVAFNTLIYEEEIPQAEELIERLYKIGVDALIIQDMGILRMNIPPIPLHASTQTDNRTLDKIHMLEEIGFEQVVLARELNIEEIQHIAQNVHHTKLEVFVHGALCNGISGQCYLSQAIKQRSANRGNCAQLCRLPYDLIDATGKKILTGKHLLSPKDLNRSEQLEALLKAGASSFKIEGRLKEVSYVKNITAYYRQLLDHIFAKHPEYRPTSSQSQYKYSFISNPSESFNRGFTNLQTFEDTLAIHSPKSMGTPIGTVKSAGRKEITISGIQSIANGDGLCYLNEKGQLEGFRVNKAEDNVIYTNEPIQILPKTPLFRNFNHEFEKLLAKPSAERKIEISITLSENQFGFHLTAIDSDGHKASLTFETEKQEAQKPQRPQIEKALSKLGDTPFIVSEIRVEWSKEYFIPSSLLTEWRRQLIDLLTKTRDMAFRRIPFRPKQTQLSEPKELSYLANIANSKAEELYRSMSEGKLSPAFELSQPKEATLLFSKHCIKHFLGYCTKHQTQKMPYQEPLSLESKDFRLKLEFDCKECLMKIKVQK